MKELALENGMQKKKKKKKEKENGMHWSGLEHYILIVNEGFHIVL